MSKLVLVTGAGGFVGQRLVAGLARTLGPDWRIHAWAREATAFGAAATTDDVDITHADHVRAGIARLSPHSVLHLAASARSSYDPAEVAGVWKVNLDGTLNLAHALLATAPQAWLLNVSSGMVFGATPHGSRMAETDPVGPNGAYAASKYAAEVALGQLAAQGLRFVTARPFNHSGPGQSTDFFVPALITRILNQRATLDGGVLKVRNADHVRDFLHVDDVVDSYVRMHERRDDLAVGEILNVCSGSAVTVGDIARHALEVCGVSDCEVVSEPAHSATDLPWLVGDDRQIRRKLGWAPARDWRQMVHDTHAAILAAA